MKTERVVEYVHAVGSLRASQSIIVRPEIDGLITEIHFKEGQSVARGAPLFTLDDSIYRAELEQSQASLRLSNLNYARARELLQKRVGTVRARDESLSKLEVDRAAVELAKARLAKTRIHAAFRGVTGLKRVDLGSYVKAGQDLVTLDDIDPLQIDFDVPERYLRYVGVGQAVRIALDALPGQMFQGQITAISPRVNLAGRTLSIRAHLPNDDRVLRPGLFARIAVVVDERHGAIVVPEQAIVPEGEDLFVFRVVDGTARRAKVSVGLRVYGRAEIVSGLARGDVIITAGQMKVRDGVPVTVLAPAGRGG